MAKSYEMKSNGKEIIKNAHKKIASKMSSKPAPSRPQDKKQSPNFYKA